MIIIVGENRSFSRRMVAGDTLTVQHQMRLINPDQGTQLKKDSIITREFTKSVELDYCALFIFCNGDYRADGHVCVFLGQLDNLPWEMINARHLGELDHSQQERIYRDLCIEVV